MSRVEKASRGGSRATVQVHTQSTTPVLELAGELDIASVPGVRRAVEAAIADHPERVVFDLAGVTFMDSSGLSLLVLAIQRVERVEIRRPPPLVTRLVELTGLSSKLRVVD